MPSQSVHNSDRIAIVSYEQQERLTFDFLKPNNKKVVFSWSGSTDTLCEKPYILIFDVDNNGYDDVYFHGCRGHGFLPYEQISHQLNFVDLGQFDLQDAPGLTTFWFEELKTRGWRLLSIGATLTITGLSGIGYITLKR